MRNIAVGLNFNGHRSPQRPVHGAERIHWLGSFFPVVAVGLMIEKQRARRTMDVETTARRRSLTGPGVSAIPHLRHLPLVWTLKRR